jgi:rod shape-determining protein MreD
MIKKIIFTIFFIFLLTLLQVSFFAHFRIKGASPNILLIAFALISFFSKPKSNFIFLVAISSGLFLDIFSSSFFGLYSLIFIILALINKKLSISIEKKTTFSLVLILLASLFFYQLALTLFRLIFQNKYLFFNIWSLLYDFILGLILYFIYVFCRKRIKSKKK